MGEEAQDAQQEMEEEPAPRRGRRPGKGARSKRRRPHCDCRMRCCTPPFTPVLTLQRPLPFAEPVEQDEEDYQPEEEDEERAGKQPAARRGRQSHDGGEAGLGGGPTQKRPRRGGAGAAGVVVKPEPGGCWVVNWRQVVGGGRSLAAVHSQTLWAAEHRVEESGRTEARGEACRVRSSLLTFPPALLLVQAATAQGRPGGGSSAARTQAAAAPPTGGQLQGSCVLWS